MSSPAIFDLGHPKAGIGIETVTRWRWSTWSKLRAMHEAIQLSYNKRRYKGNWKEHTKPGKDRHNWGNKSKAKTDTTCCNENLKRALESSEETPLIENWKERELLLRSGAECKRNCLRSAVSAPGRFETLPLKHSPYLSRRLKCSHNCTL